MGNHAAALVLFAAIVYAARALGRALTHIDRMGKPTPRRYRRPE